MTNETESAAADRTAMACTAVGGALATAGILFSPQSSPETYLQYALLIGGVAFAVAGFLKAWNDRRTGA